MLEISFFILGLAVLIVASITDFKIREVPDWLSYSFIFIAILANIIISIIKNDYWYILNSLAGALFAFLLGLVLFYSGQWGGGDSKVMIGLFTLIGFNIQSFYSLITGNLSIIPYLLSSTWFLLIINIALVGVIYGLIFSIFLATKNKKLFLSIIKKTLDNRRIKVLRKTVLTISGLIVLIALATFFFSSSELYTSIYIAVMAILLLVLFYGWLFAKAIDKGYMYKKIRANKITIGDWTVDKIFAKKRAKNLLQEALDEYRIINESKIHPNKFRKKLAKKLIAYKYGFLKSVFSNRKKLEEYQELITDLLRSSSEKNLIKKAKKHSLAKKDIEDILDFLDKENIYFDKIIISDVNSTGLNEEQVKIINDLYKKKKLKFIKVKEGIPFVPSFLIAFIILQVIGFWWTFFI